MMQCFRMLKLAVCLVALLLAAACTHTDLNSDETTEDLIIWAGGTYSGDLSNALPHGRGLWIHPDGYYYDGEWEFGLKSGFGEWLTVGGDSYEGLWKEDSQHGYGKYRGRDGEVYDGEWAEGFFEGSGVWRNKHGDKYSGEFKAGLFHGEGVWVGANGDKYMGIFAYGERHGEGIFVGADGISVEGVWVEGFNSELEALLAKAAEPPDSAAGSSAVGGFKVTGLRFFSSDLALSRTRFRNYSSTFSRNNSEQYIFWELEIALPNKSSAREVVITSYLQPFGFWDTASYHIPEGYDTYRLAGPQSSRYNTLPGGSYTMEIRLGDRDGRVIATGSFQID
jgi:hypothetical protein